MTYCPSCAGCGTCYSTSSAGYGSSPAVYGSGSSAQYSSSSSYSSSNGSGMYKIAQEYGRSQKVYSPSMSSSTERQNIVIFNPDQFIIENHTDFISSEDESKQDEIMQHVKDAFRATTDNEFPNDIAIKVCSSEELRQMFEQSEGRWSEGIQGFCLNRKGFGTSTIFVKENDLARLMLTIGHEIGHAMSCPLRNSKDEEAKAYSFSLAWMDSIVKNNIAGLSTTINPMPAENGLHDVAFSFVKDLIDGGKTPINIHSELINSSITIDNLIDIYG